MIVFKVLSLQNSPRKRRFNFSFQHLGFLFTLTEMEYRMMLLMNQRAAKLRIVA